jgi:MobA/MobL family
MALYSLRHEVVSKVNPADVGKVAARLSYICRPGVLVLQERTGLAAPNARELRRFAATREQAAGRNGRIAESFIIALPLEGSRQQHQALVRHFAEALTRGTAGWVAAIHYNRPRNPHFHILAFDESTERKAGQRGRSPKVMGLSRTGALDEVRALWARSHNTLMSTWGFPQRQPDRPSFVRGSRGGENSDAARGTQDPRYGRARRTAGKPDAGDIDWTDNRLATDRSTFHARGNEFARPFGQFNAKDKFPWTT